jgi:hypothetical protein
LVFCPIDPPSWIYHTGDIFKVFFTALCAAPWQNITTLIPPPTQDKLCVTPPGVMNWSKSILSLLDIKTHQTWFITHDSKTRQFWKCLLIFNLNYLGKLDNTELNAFFKCNNNNLSYTESKKSTFFLGHPVFFAVTELMTVIVFLTIQLPPAHR